MQEELIFVDSNGKTVNKLYALSPKEKLFDEQWLQELLIANPMLLPCSELDSNWDDLIPLGREVSVTAGSIDNLYVTSDGLICLVETKLWRNPEAHRTVVAQILDYTKDLSNMSFAEFKDCIEKSNLEGGKADFWHRISSKISNVNKIEFQNEIQNCLSHGRFLLLIVGDKIYPEVAMLIDTIQSAPNLEFKIGLVEIRMFKTKKVMSWPVLVIPRVVGETNEVTRAVVKILYEKKRPEIDVTTIDEGAPNVMDIKTFDKSMIKEYADIFMPILEQWIKDGFSIKWGRSGLSVYFYWEKRMRSLVEFYPGQISLLTEELVRKKGLPKEPYHNYRNTIDTIPFVRQLFTQGRQYLNYERDFPLEEFRILINATDKLVREMNDYRKAE